MRVLHQCYGAWSGRQVARSDAASGPARGRLITKKSNKRSGIETNKEMTLLAGARARGLRTVGLDLGLDFGFGFDSCIGKANLQYPKSTLFLAALFPLYHLYLSLPLPPHTDPPSMGDAHTGLRCPCMGHRRYPRPLV